MSVVLIILSCVLFAVAVYTLVSRPAYAPALAYLGLLSLSFAQKGSYPLLPINGVILTGWLCMTVVVMLATMMQPAVVRNQSRGMGYIIVGAFVGLAIGLLGYTVTDSFSALYGIMIVAVAAGIFFGFLLYSRTPDGAPVSIRSGNFYRYLMAKGFPTAITVMQMGVVLVLLIAVANAHK